MNAQELLEQLNFAVNAIQKKTNADFSTYMVKGIVSTPIRKVVLDIKEIGFDDKSGIIYLEIE